MGSTLSPATSLRITIGIFDTGSINKPRIVISTSIVTSRTPSSFCVPAVLRFLYPHFAYQAVGKAGRDPRWDVASHLGSGRFRRRKVQRLVLRSAADPLPAGFISPLNHYF